MNVFDVTAEQRGALLADAKRSTLPRGDMAYVLGDRTDFVFFVDSGCVKIVRTNAGGSESIVGIRNPGDIFGELSWMTGAADRATSAIAIDPSVVWRLDTAAFEQRLRADAALAAAFARGLARRLATIERELTELAGKSVPGRLVDTLGLLAAEHGVAEESGSVRIAINLTHKDLADLIGTSRETLTKELSVLADVGLVRVAHRTIVLLQPQAFPFVVSARESTGFERASAARR